MKKFLLSLAGLAVLAIGAIASTISFTPAHENFKNNDGKYSAAEFEFTIDGIQFKAHNINRTSGQAKVNATGLSAFYLKNVDAIDGLQSVTLTFDVATIGTWYAKVSDSEAISSAATTSDVKGTIDEKTVTFDFSDSNAKYFLANITTKGSSTVKLVKVEIEYLSGGEVAKEECQLSFGVEDYTADMAGENYFPSLTNPQNLPVTWSSSDANVASVDADGNITLVGTGTCTIKAETAGSETVKAGNDHYQLIVENSSLVEYAIYFDANHKGPGNSAYNATYTQNMGTEEAPVKWTITNFNNNNNGWNGNIKCGAKSATEGTAKEDTGSISTQFTIAEPLTEASINITDIVNGTVTSVVVSSTSSIEGDNITWTELGKNEEVAKGIVKVALTGATANQYYKVDVNTSNSTTKNAVATVTFVKLVAPKATVAKVAFPFENNVVLSEGSYLSPGGESEIKVNMPEGADPTLLSFVLESQNYFDEPGIEPLDGDDDEEIDPGFWGPENPVYGPLTLATYETLPNICDIVAMTCGKDKVIITYAGDATYEETSYEIPVSVYLDLSEMLYTLSGGIKDSHISEATGNFHVPDYEDLVDYYGLEEIHYMVTPAAPVARPELRVPATHTLYDHKQGIQIPLGNGSLHMIAVANGVESPNYEFSFVNITTGVGVSELPADLEEGVLYDLNGLRVSKAEKGGVYVVRKGADTFKIAVK